MGEWLMDWRESHGLEWLEARLAGARVAFTTRIGGVSDQPYDGLNLGIHGDDDRSSVLENRRRLAAALGLDPGRIAVGRQVHGADLAVHAGRQVPSWFTEPGDGTPAVDGHVVADPGVAALVFVADCLPVALAGTGGVAILHCGWRGLAAGILARGTAAVGATDAAIGPGIGPCCYEVGEDVLDAFAGIGPGIASDRMLDLNEVVRRLLGQAGVERVEAAGLCTSCEASRFYSHRRDAGRTGRQAGLAWLEEEAN
jgi:purine-nucleoside/S-methyl-5'-thioadenosine phosphorylase / adenosine deaminase